MGIYIYGVLKTMDFHFNDCLSRLLCWFFFCLVGLGFGFLWVFSLFVFVVFVFFSLFSFSLGVLGVLVFWVCLFRFFLVNGFWGVVCLGVFLLVLGKSTVL